MAHRPSATDRAVEGRGSFFPKTIDANGVTVLDASAAADGQSERADSEQFRSLSVRAAVSQHGIRRASRQSAVPIILMAHGERNR